MCEVLNTFEMTCCNIVTNTSKTNAKLDECNDEERVEATMYKPICKLIKIRMQYVSNICYGMRIITRFMNEPRKSHLVAIKRIHQYLKRNMKLDLLFLTVVKYKNACLIGYSYSNLVGDKIDRRSTSSDMFKYNGASISWCIKKQLITILSSCEVVYIGGTFSSSCEAIRLDSLMKELKCEVHKSLKLMNDNISTIHIEKNPILRGRNKYIETRFPFIREQVMEEMLEVTYCPIEVQHAYNFTRALKIYKIVF